MATTAVKLVEEGANYLPVTHDGNGGSAGEEAGIRILLADQQAIFRAGLRKIFAVEDDIRVVGQAESLVQTLSSAGKFAVDVLILESALAADPAEAVADFIRKSHDSRVIVVTEQPEQEITLECLRRGAHAVISREIEPDQLIECVRSAAAGEPWLDLQGMKWVLNAFRNNASRPPSARSKVQLTPKESVIVACVTQGMKNKEIAHRVGTTEQVVKNYLRKVYDKLGVADRLELALFCLHNKIVDTSSVPAAPKQGEAPLAAAAAAAAAGNGRVS
jgi:DNA-binding NarL/FixJ family response regulator